MNTYRTVTPPLPCPYVRRVVRPVGNRLVTWDELMKDYIARGLITVRPKTQLRKV